jgi:hypothetical protein
MMNEYYIITDESRAGPYDIVALVRKIRNGSLTQDTLVEADASKQVKPAQEWSELVDFFSNDNEEVIENTAGHLQSHSLTRTLEGGVRFLQSNLISTVFSGVLILAVFFLLAISLLLPDSMHLPGYIICFILSHFLLSFYMLSVLRMTRGQPVDIYIFSKIVPHIGQLFLASLLITIPADIGLGFLVSGLTDSSWVIAIIGLFIFAVPGLLALALFAFSPILIFDQNYKVFKAMQISFKSIVKSGTENTGVLFSLLAINFVAGLFALLPMAITLPITTSALTEIYDEFFG